MVKLGISLSYKCAIDFSTLVQDFIFSLFFYFETESCYIDQADPEIVILLPQPPQS